jgi:hypothetical protein
MKQSIVVLLFVVGAFGSCIGCSQIEKQADYGNMTGAIPQDSWLSSLGSGKNR